MMLSNGKPPAASGHVSVMCSPVAVRIVPSTPNASDQPSTTIFPGARSSSRPSMTSRISPAPTATDITVL
ncbi:Uncharacterised protein [Mycobacteroides abscessus]|nr:Uncharacterised protein [Mycobacteroides abscessus]